MCQDFRVAYDTVLSLYHLIIQAVPARRDKLPFREKLPQLILPVGVPAYHEHFLFAPFGQLCFSAGFRIPFLPAFAQGIEIGAHLPQLGLLRGYLLFLPGRLLLQSPQFLLLFQNRILQPPFF